MYLITFIVCNIYITFTKPFTKELKHHKMDVSWFAFTYNLPIGPRKKRELL
jgi:hypothetical protein